MPSCAALSLDASCWIVRCVLSYCVVCFVLSRVLTFFLFISLRHILYLHSVLPVVFASFAASLSVQRVVLCNVTCVVPSVPCVFRALLPCCLALLFVVLSVLSLVYWWHC